MEFGIQRNWNLQLKEASAEANLQFRTQSRLPLSKFCISKLHRPGSNIFRNDLRPFRKFRPAENIRIKFSFQAGWIIHSFIYFLSNRAILES